MSNPENRPGWRFSYPIDVRFEDIDMFHHVNNAKYLTYIESARVAYYTQVSGIENPREFGMTLASAKVDYIKPVFFGQKLNVLTRTARIGNKSWTLEHELRDSSTGDLMASASTVNVYYDYKTGQSQVLPAEIVARLEEYEGRKLKDQ